MSAHLPAENDSTKDLFKRSRQLLAVLEQQMLTRKDRDRACTSVTDLYMLLEVLARRINSTDFRTAGAYHGKEARQDTLSYDEEVEEPVDDAHDEPEALSLADLLNEPLEEVEELDEGARQSVITFFRAYELLRNARLVILGLLLDYMCKGCSSLDQVTKKVLALCRRVRPESMAMLGLSQADVGRLLGEGRATTQARERRVFEKPLLQAGARGFHGLGGQRGQQHREACAKAQRGNNNRRGGRAAS